MSDDPAPATPPPPCTPQALLRQIAALGITASTVTHEAVFTVAESKALRGVIDGGHVKNLFLKDKKGRLFCVTALESAQIDLKRLHEKIGASGRVSFAGPEQLWRHWGVTPGSVTPLGAVNDRDRAVTVVLDAAMLALPRLNVHPLTNTMSTGIDTPDLLRLLEALDHPPLIVPVSHEPDQGAA
jgi:Ala-tRNA(Pro) deacylase